jgi:hypothetical protein
MVIVNAHYYGILFVMANFIFYCGYCFIKKTAVKNIFKFLAVNIIIAVSFMPFFIYKLFIDRYDFSRSDCVIQLDHVIIFVVFAVFGILAFIHRGKISSVSFVADNKKTGWAYIFCITVLIFMLSFLISIAKPMIRYHYLLLTTCPFLLAVAAAVIAALPKNKTGIAAQIILCLLMGNALYWGKSDIPGGRYDFYRECYRFITLDTEAHSGQNAAMIDNAPRLAAYYHEPLLPLYASENTYDVVYGFQQGFESGEKTMYDAFSDAGLSGSSTLKIIPNANGKIVIFKTLP